MNTNMNEKRGRAAIIAAVAVLMLAAVCFVGVGAGSEDVEAADSGTFTVGEQDYDSLPEAVTDAKAADDKTVSLNGDAVVNLSSDLDLTGVTIDCGTFQLNIVGDYESSVTVTGGIITGEGEGKYASGDLVVNLSNKVNFTETQFAMTSNGNNSQYAIPFAAITISSGSTIVLDGCSFTCDTNGTFGAIQNSGDLTVKNCQMSSGIITVKSKTTIDGTEGVLLQFVSTMAVDNSKLVLQNGSTIAQTIIGWDDSNSSYDSTHTPTNQIITTITISQDIDLGELRSGNDQYSASKTTAGATINANVTVYGGEGIKTVTINTGKALIVPADETFTATGTVTNNGSIIVNGTLDASSATVTNNANITVAGTAKFASGSNITVNALPGADVTGATSDQIDGEITVNTISEASQYLQTPGMVITYTGTEALTSDIVVGSGVTLKTIDTGAYFNIGTYDIIVDGGRFTGKIHDGTSVISEIDLSGDYTISKGSTEIDGDIYGGSVSSRADDVVVSGNITGEITVKTASRDGANSVIFKDVTFGPNGKVIITGGDVVIDDTFGDVVIDEPTADVTVSVKNGEAYSGNIVYRFTDASGNKQEYIIPVTATAPSLTNMAIATVDVDAYKLTLSNIDFETMTLDAPVVLAGTNTVKTGETLIFGVDGNITLSNGSSLYVYGNIEKTSAADAKDKINNDATGSKVYYTSQNKSAVLACVTNENNTALIGANGVGNLDDFKANSYPGSVIYLTADITITGTVELENVTIYTNGHSITVGDGNTGATLSLIGCTIDSEMPANVYQTEDGPNAADTTVSDNEKIIIKNKSVMEYQDSLIFVVVDAEEGSSVEGSNEGVSYDNTASEVRVGYGTTLELKGRTVSAIDVFGDLVVTSTVTLSSGNAMNVYSGGTVTVDGTFSINGTADLKAGSVTVVSESGSITVGSKNGGSVMTVSGKLTVDGSFTVASPSGGSTARNDLAITGGEFVVNGTMAMNDRFSGQIQDRGDVTINGTSNGGSVKVYAGVTLTVASVSGSMEVTDAGIITISQALEGVSEQSNGNTITLENVRGVTITETSETVNWVDDSKATHRDYVCYMDISGSITTASNGTIIVGGTTIGVGKNDDQFGTVTVDGELVLTKDIAMTVSGKLDVSGTVSAVIEGSSVTMNNGVLTVTGTVTVRDNEISGSGTINAAHYELAATADIIYDRHVYTDFKSAVEAAADAVMDTVDILGGVSAGEEVTVDAGITISIAANSRLSVSEGVTVTIADGATVTGYNSSSIRVYGTLTSLDYENDMEVKNIIADVVVTDGAARTWTSLANAVAGAGEGDVITTNGVIVISSDLTIPSGVTVYSEFPVYVTNEATLTVAGTMTMDVKAQAEKTLDGTPYHGLGINTGASVVVSGIMSVETQGQTGAEIGDDIDGAHFAIGDGAVTINYVSNVAFAAETVSGNADLIGNVTIKGAVTAGDVEFSVGEDQAAYSVLVNNHDYTDAVDTVFAFGTIGLNGVTLVIDDEISMASGTVSAPCGDGASEASVQLSRANGVTIASASSPLADGTLYTMTLTGISAGSATVASGTVALGTMTVTGGSVLTIASGATATVAANVQISIANDGKNALVVEGTLDIADNGRIVAYNSNYGGVTVSGTMQVGTFTIASDLQYDVTGTIAVDDGRVMTVNGLVIVGDKPASLGEQASGTITGTVSIVENSLYYSVCILAYAGADLGDADINLNAATGESNALITSYVINGTEYATLYVNSEIPIYMIEVLDDGISLSGLSTSGEWYATQQDAERGENPVAYNDENYDYGADVGDYTTVYAYYHPSTVLGTISKDAGIILTIDGNVVNYGGLTGGTGDASFTTSYELSVGTHTIAWSERTGYDYSGVTLTFNGQTVENGGTITITADMQSFTIIASGAVPSQGGQTGGDNGLGLTDYLLIILVILIVVMAVMVALRLMRS